MEIDISKINQESLESIINKDELTTKTNISMFNYLSEYISIISFFDDNYMSLIKNIDNKKYENNIRLLKNILYASLHYEITSRILENIKIVPSNIDIFVRNNPMLLDLFNKQIELLNLSSTNIKYKFKSTLIDDIDVNEYFGSLVHFFLMHILYETGKIVSRKKLRFDLKNFKHYDLDFNDLFKQKEQLLKIYQEKDNKVYFIVTDDKKTKIQQRQDNLVIKGELQENFERVSFDDIIGNEENKKIMKKIAELLVMYNPVFKENPIKFPNTWLIYGDKGTGKSLSIKALRTYIYDLSKKYNRKFTFINLTDSMFKDSYYSMTEKKLENAVKQISNPEGIGVLVIDDADGLLLHRNQLKNKPTEKSINRILMNYLSGIDSMNRYNALYIIITNSSKEIDPAMLERFKSIQFYFDYLKSSKEYIDLIKLKLSNYNVIYDIDQGSFNRIGEFCLNKKISGRSLDNIIKELSLNSLNFETKPEFYDINKKPEQIKDLINKQRTKITAKDFMTRLFSYLNHENLQKQRVIESEYY